MDQKKYFVFEKLNDKNRFESYIICEHFAKNNAVFLKRVLDGKSVNTMRSCYKFSKKLSKLITSYGIELTSDNVGLYELALEELRRQKGKKKQVPTKNIAIKEVDCCEYIG